MSAAIRVPQLREAGGVGLVPQCNAPSLFALLLEVLLDAGFLYSPLRRHTKASTSQTSFVYKRDHVVDGKVEDVGYLGGG